MGGNVSTENKDESPLAIPLDSAEYKFCEKFLGILADEEKLSEFRKRFQDSSDGNIHWDFWTEEKSYESAFKKCLKEIKRLTREDAKDLYIMASHVTHHRGAELDRRMGVYKIGHDAHLQAYYNWMKIVDKLLEKVQAPDADSLFVVAILLSTGVFAAVGLYNFIQEYNETVNK